MSQIITCIFWKWHDLSLLTCMHIPTHGMSVTGQIYSLVSLFPKWNSFGHWGYPGAAEFTVALSCVLGWHQRVWEAEISFFFGFSAKFCLTVMRYTCVASGKVERLVGYHCKGARVLCFMVINCSIKSPLPVSWNLIALLRSPSPCKTERKTLSWKYMLSKIVHFWGMARGCTSSHTIMLVLNLHACNTCEYSHIFTSLSTLGLHHYSIPFIDKCIINAVFLKCLHQ